MNYEYSSNELSQKTNNYLREYAIYYTFSSESSRSVAKTQKSNFQDPTDLCK